MRLSWRHEYVRQGRPNHHPSGCLRLSDLVGPMLGADLSLAERDGDFFPARAPVWGLPVGLTLLENPISGFRQVAGGGTDGGAVTLPEGHWDDVRRRVRS
jgi:hypothetical protein